MFGAHPMLRTGGAVSYSVPYALRFRAANSAYLSRTSGASPTSKRTFTYSAWIKAAPSLSSSTQIALVSSSANNGMIGWNIVSFGGRLFIRNDAANDIQFSGLFRDPSAWGHLVVAIDTTQATSSDRVKVYWNGVAMTYLSGTYPSLNYDSYLNAASTAYRIMSDTVNGTYVDGYLAEMNFIDGQALTPSSFGQTDSATGVWVPKAYAGTYGTNGFYLKFADASAATATAIGKDSSGNGNNWTPSGISVTSGTTFDQMLDTPTLNYAVWSPIDRGDTGLDVTNGNLGYTISNAVSGLCRATFAASTGKWYWEMTAGANWTASPQHGISPVTASNTGDATAGNGYGWESAATSRLFANGAAVSNYGTQINSGDVLMIAVDFDAGKIWYGRNGTWFGSPAGDPAAGTNQSQTITTGVTYAPMFGRDSSNATTTNFVNFGQRAFAYTPPSGFKALNTANLPTPSIKKGSLYMDATLRTGTGATASVSSLGFQPDLVWIKSRSAATDHGLYDAVRGVQKQLESNTTTAETTEATGLTAFSSNGYTVGALAQLNTSAATYVDWAWKEGATPGFDIVTYVGNGTNRTISHNLGAVPKLIILRSREATNTGRWTVQHGYYGSARYAYLNETFAFDTANANLRWNSTDPTSSVFSIGTSSDVNHTSDNYVGYLWSEIEGFSKFGSYTGNGSTDGPFVWCGHRPRWLMIKDATTANLGWRIYDTVRETFNEMGGGLEASSAAAENYATSVRAIDVLSNGFKIRVSASGMNGSGVVFVFAAFAENPFKYARAR